jgi:formylmethanofuran--tetrahydromethanopterin N-formyltransferase
MSFKLNGVEVEDTFAEAFPMIATRILITAADEHWVHTAASVTTGFASSIIMSPAEAGMERLLDPKETPDGRIGALVQIYHRTLPELKYQVLARVGQCVLTCPTTALFDGLPQAKRKMRIGRAIGKFGDGFENVETLYGRNVYRIPVMEGFFILEDAVGVVRGVAGGNLIIMGDSEESALKGATEAVNAIREYCKDVIMPFPGGIVRSGSKVGSLKYPKLLATTNHPLCPALRDKVTDSKVPPNVKSILEIVINGLSLDAVTLAQGMGMIAAAGVDGVVKITSVNFGGKLGPFHIRTKEAIEKAKAICASR